MIVWILIGLTLFLTIVWTEEWLQRRSKTKRNQQLRREAQEKLRQ